MSFPSFWIRPSAINAALLLTIPGLVQFLAAAQLEKLGHPCSHDWQLHLTASASEDLHLARSALYHSVFSIIPPTPECDISTLFCASFVGCSSWAISSRIRLDFCVCLSFAFAVGDSHLRFRWLSFRKLPNLVKLGGKGFHTLHLCFRSCANLSVLSTCSVVAQICSYFLRKYHSLHAPLIFQISPQFIASVIFEEMSSFEAVSQDVLVFSYLRQTGWSSTVYSQNTLLSMTCIWNVHTFRQVSVFNLLNIGTSGIVCFCLKIFIFCQEELLGVLKARPCIIRQCHDHNNYSFWISISSVEFFRLYDTLYIQRALH